jgi:hypothetical protein
MAAISSPYGIQPIGHNDGTVRTQRLVNGIQSGFGSNIYKFQPVKINPATGTLIPIVLNTDPIAGVFAGVEYAPTGGRPAFSKFWPAGTIPDPAQDFLVYWWPAWDAQMRFRIQADGSVPQTQLGSGFNLSNIASGNTAPGTSMCTAAAAGVPAGTQAQLTLYEFWDTEVSSLIGDAFTDLVVMVSNPQLGTSSPTSIG